LNDFYNRIIHSNVAFQLLTIPFSTGFYIFDCLHLMLHFNPRVILFLSRARLQDNLTLGKLSWKQF